MTSGKGKRKIHYYATKGFYLTAACVDEIVVETITRFLNSDMSNLPINLVTVLKRIDITNMNFAEKRNLIQSLVEKIVYSQEQLIYTLTIDAQKLQPFIKDHYVNQNVEPMEYIIGDNSITITEKVFLRKYVNTVYDRGKNGVLNVTDNNHLILKAFTTAWKYRELYEQDGNVDNIIHNARTSPRLFYKYLALAYLNPNIVNMLLKGKLEISVRDILDKASRNDDFNIQEKIFCS